jgi:hypothetical protein
MSDWELVKTDGNAELHRIRIDGGFLYRNTISTIHDFVYKEVHSALVFVPLSEVENDPDSEIYNTNKNQENNESTS